MELWEDAEQQEQSLYDADVMEAPQELLTVGRQGKEGQHVFIELWILLGRAIVQNAVGRREQEIEIGGEAEAIGEKEEGVKDAQPSNELHALGAKAAVKKGIPAHVMW